MLLTLQLVEISSVATGSRLSLTASGLWSSHTAATLVAGFLWLRLLSCMLESACSTAGIKAGNRRRDQAAEDALLRLGGKEPSKRQKKGSCVCLPSSASPLSSLDHGGCSDICGPREREYNPVKNTCLVMKSSTRNLS